MNIISAGTADAFDPLIDVTELVENRYVKEVDQQKIVTSAINGMLSELDPYSEYIPPQNEKDFNRQTSGNFTGIGIGLDLKDGLITIITPLEDSPAKRAGLKHGDVIVEIEGNSTQDWNIAKAIKEMDGPEGREIAMKIVRGEGELLSFNIKREQIQMHSVRGWYKDSSDKWQYQLDDNGIGYMRISQFIDSTLDDFNKEINSLLNNDMKALILDLRSNPGGLMFSATGIIDRLLAQGVILSTKGQHSKEEIIYAQAQDTLPEFHMVVLIDQMSASASEIVAGALRDHKRATVIGKRSWGKGSVQRTFKLPNDRGILKLTTDYYYLPGGSCVHRLPDAQIWGVEPDIDIELDLDKAQELTSILTKLTQPFNRSEDDNSIDIATLANELLQADTQLNAAYEKCLDLIKTEPGMKMIN